MTFARRWRTAISSVPLDLWLIGTLVIIALILRLWLIWDGNFLWWFDQGRDAVLAREIWQGDFKLQGPSASGTNDLLYHGVLWFYLLAPLYAIAQGSPQLVSISLALFATVIAVPAIYSLGKNITPQSPRLTGFVAGLVYVGSLDTAFFASWLSNPWLAFVALPWLYLALWTLWNKETIHPVWWYVLATSLAVSIQGILYGLYLLAFVFIVLAIAAWRRGWQFIFHRHAILALVLFGIGVSSMVLTQFKLYQAGLFQLETLRTISSGSQVSLLALAEAIGSLYHRKIVSFFSPLFPQFGVLLGLAAISGVLIPRKSSLRWFLVLWLASPLFLLVPLFRNSVHMLVGMEVFFSVGLAVALTKLLSIKRGLSIMALLITGFLAVNLSALHQYRNNRTNVFAVQTGSLYRDHRDLIRTTYDRAAGAPLSIAVLGNPFGYSVTWAYLFDWYAHHNDVTVPVWFGPEQTGIVGATLLPRTETPAQHHFAIEEPTLFLDSGYIEDFYSIQLRSTSDSGTIQYFGATKLTHYYTGK